MVKTVSALEVVLLKTQACLLRELMGVFQLSVLMEQTCPRLGGLRQQRGSTSLVLGNGEGVRLQMGSAELFIWGSPGTCSQVVVGAGVFPSHKHPGHPRWSTHVAGSVCWPSPGR